MTVRVYKSTDDSAPQLNGLAGSLITVLDAVLVNGYGTMAAAGWTKPFSGTNKAVYRSSTVNGGSGLYYRVLDNATVTDYNYPYSTTTKVCGFVGYESMSGIDTGTNPFVDTSASNYAVRKSITNDSTTRDWIVIADQYTAIILIDFQTNVASYGYKMKVMGEFYSYRAGFSWKGFNSGSSFINGIRQSNTLAGFNGVVPRNGANVLMTGHVGLFSNLSEMNVGSSLNYAYAGVPSKFYKAGSGISETPITIPYPHPISGKLNLSKIFISSNESSSMGYLRGIYLPLHTMPLQNGDIFYGTGSLSGKTFQLFNVSNQDDTINNFGRIAIEISDTWAYSA